MVTATKLASFSNWPENAAAGLFSVKQHQAAHIHVTHNELNMYFTLSGQDRAGCFSGLPIAFTFRKGCKVQFRVGSEINMNIETV